MIAYHCAPMCSQKTNAGSNISFGIPTFYLFANIQGIVNEEHAERIVHSICNPSNDPSITIYPNVTKTEIHPLTEEPI